MSDRWQILEMPSPAEQVRTACWLGETVAIKVFVVGPPFGNPLHLERLLSWRPPSNIQVSFMLYVCSYVHIII